MPYVSGDGSVQESRSVFRFSILTDLFWTIINTISLFLGTLINPTAPIPTEKDRGKYNRLHNTSFRSSNGDSKGGGGGGGPSGNNKPRPFGARVATIPKACNTGR